jgi:hypothetical protein
VNFLIILLASTFRVANDQIRLAISCALNFIPEVCESLDNMTLFIKVKMSYDEEMALRNN